MASRIGKYKVSKKESTLSLADGGTINGSLVVTSLSQSSDPGVDGQLFVTGSQWDGTNNDKLGLSWTGSAYIVLASGGN